MDERQATVYLVDDEEAVRDSLSWLLTSHGYRVQCQASAEQFLAMADGRLAGCLITDMRMPGMSGLQLHEQLIAKGVWLPTLMISGHGDLPDAVRAFRSGIDDFIEKPLDEEYLLARIEQCMSAGLQARRQQDKHQSAARRLALLSPRERDVFECVVSGKMNKHIAGFMGISIKTVEVHRRNMMEKLQAASLADLIRLALDDDIPGR